MAFLASGGDVIHVSMQNGEKHIGIDVFHFSKSCRSFRRTVKKLLPLGITGSELAFVSVRCLLNSSTGMYQVCLLLRQAQMKQSNTEEFHVLLLEDYDSVLLLGSFEIRASKISDIEFHFVDGPAVCWSLQGTLYFSRYNFAAEQFTTDSIIVDNSMKEQPGVDFNLLWCALIKNQMVAMGSKSEMTDDTGCVTRWTCVNHHQNDVQEIPLIPNVYVPIVTCCLVREPFEAVASGHFNSPYDGLDVYFTTNRGQLLNFVNGCLKNCWQLPFSDPCRMWMLEVIKTVLVLGERDGNACQKSGLKSLNETSLGLKLSLFPEKYHYHSVLNKGGGGGRGAVEILLVAFTMECVMGHMT